MPMMSMRRGGRDFPRFRPNAVPLICCPYHTSASVWGGWDAEGASPGRIDLNPESSPGPATSPKMSSASLQGLYAAHRSWRASHEDMAARSPTQATMQQAVSDTHSASHSPVTALCHADAQAPTGMVVPVETHDDLRADFLSSRSLRIRNSSTETEGRAETRKSPRREDMI